MHRDFDRPSEPRGQSNGLVGTEPLRNFLPRAVRDTRCEKRSDGRPCLVRDAGSVLLRVGRPPSGRRLQQRPPRHRRRDGQVLRPLGSPAEIRFLRRPRSNRHLRCRTCPSPIRAYGHRLQPGVLCQGRSIPAAIIAITIPTAILIAPGGTRPGPSSSSPALEDRMIWFAGSHRHSLRNGASCRDGDQGSISPRCSYCLTDTGGFTSRCVTAGPVTRRRRAAPGRLQAPLPPSAPGPDQARVS